MDWHDGPWAVLDVKKATPTQLLVYSLVALQFRNTECKTGKIPPTPTAFIDIVAAEYDKGTSQAGEVPAKWKGLKCKPSCRPQLLVNHIMYSRNKHLYTGMHWLFSLVGLVDLTG